MIEDTLREVVPRERADGYLLLLRALALQRVRLQRFPGQILLITSTASERGRTSFVHSVGSSTKISTVTFTLQKRFRRALLEWSSVPIPRGATFAFRSVQSPVRYAEKVGYPVVVKEVFGENPSFSHRDIHDEEALAAAAREIQQHLPTTTSRAPSSYAQSINLSSAEEENGELVKSSNSRYLIEKQILGRNLRVYVVDEVPILTLESHGDRYEVAQPDRAVPDVATAAVSSISGIRNATVDVVEDPDGSVFVTELSERLVFPVVQGEALDAYLAVIDRLLGYELGEAEVPFDISEAPSRVHVAMAGLDAGLEPIHTVCREIGGVEAELESRREGEGTLDVRLEGVTSRIAAVLDALCEQEIVSHLTIDSTPN